MNPTYETRAEDVIFIIERTFAAPRQRAYQAWIDPEMMAQWWGPKGMTCSVKSDPQRGGTYEWIMHDQAMNNYPCCGQFLEIVENERLVMTMWVDGHDGNFHDLVETTYHQCGGPEGTQPSCMNITHVTFEDYDGGTKLTIRQIFDRAATRDAYMKIGNREGWGSSLEKLEALLG